MPKIISASLSYDNQPCNRCGSKRRISKTWKETLPKLTGGFVVQIHSQIVCTNSVCQAEFDRKLFEEVQKRKDLRLKREIGKSK